MSNEKHIKFENENERPAPAPKLGRLKSSKSNIYGVIYNEDKMPPDWELAENHQKARSVGVEDRSSQKEIYCDCCAYFVKRTPVPLCCNLEQLGFLGTGYPLFFYFIKYLIFLLAILLLTSGGFNLISNTFGTYCEPLEAPRRPILITKPSNSSAPANTADAQVGKENLFFRDCDLDWVMTVSLPNRIRAYDSKMAQEYLNLVTVLVFIILFQWWRRQQRIIEAKCDILQLEATDYTVAIRNIPTGLTIDYDDELKKFLVKELFNGNEENIVNINLSFDLDRQINLQKEKKKAINEKKKAFKIKYKTGKFPEGVNEKTLDDAIQEQEDKLEALEKEFLEGKSKDFAGWAFVSFRTEEIKKEVLTNYHTSLKKKMKILLGIQQKQKNPLKFKENLLIIEEAASPTDVFWENLKFSEKEKHFRRSLGFFIQIVLIVACAGLIFWLNRYQQREKRLKMAALPGDPVSAPKSSGSIFVLVIALAIPFVNFLLVECIKQLANFEKYSTRTEYFLKVASNVSFAQFINTALVTFVIAFIDDNPYFYQQGGLLHKQNMVFILNMAIPIAVHAVFPFGIIKGVMRWLELRNKDKSVLTQAEAQILFEKPSHQMAVALGELMKNMYFSAFYAAVFPLGVVWTLSGTCILYWIHKYNVLRRVTVKYNLGSELFSEMTEHLEYFVVIYAVMNLVFDKLFFNHIPVPAIVCLVIALLHALLPMKELNLKLFPTVKIDRSSILTKEDDENDDDVKIKDYAKAEEEDFSTDYQRENPATKEEATEKWLEINRKRQFKKTKSTDV